MESTTAGRRPACIARRRATRALAAAFLATAAATAWQAGATALPDKPVRLVAGVPPGGPVDTYARVIAEALGKRLERTVLVENKSGANGNIAAQHVLQQTTDGTTLWVGTQAMVEINPAAFRKLPWAPADFIPLVKGVESALVLAVHPSVPATTLEELVAWARTNPGTGYASFSPGTPSHFLGYQLAETNGLDMVHVPYRGAAPQTADMVGGHAKVGFMQLQSSVPLFSEGKLTPIATTGAQRSRLLPDVPTLHELGMPEIDATVWFGLLAPAATPPEALAELKAALRDVHADPALRRQLEDAGYDVSGLEGEALQRAIEQSRQRWARLVEATGFNAEE